MFSFLCSKRHGQWESSIFPILSFAIAFPSNSCIFSPFLCFVFLCSKQSWFRWHNIYLFSFLFDAARDSEILRLKQLLDEKAEKSNSKATGLLGRTPESILENSTPMSPKRKTPLSHGKVKRVQLSENAPHSSPTEESQEVSLETSVVPFHVQVCE